MNTKKKPWQVAPSDFIAFAIKHANKGTDFDKQVAFLVLDVGVETTIKTYLAKYKRNEFKEIQKKAAKDGREVSFFTIVTAIKDLAGEKIPEFDPDKILGFHEQRNDLYHNQTRLNPPDDDLRSYIDLAKTLLKVLLDIDVEEIEHEPKSKYTVWDEKLKVDRTIEDLTSELSERLRYFHESCAIIVEQLQPNFATRKFALEFQSIWEKYSYADSDFETELINAQLKIKNSNERLTRYNELTGKQSENHEVIDFLLEDINHFYAIRILQKLSANFKEDWDKYLDIIDTVDELPRKWERMLDNSNLDADKIYREYVDVVSQIESRQNQLDEWIKENIPNINRSKPGPFLEDF